LSIRGGDFAAIYAATHPPDIDAHPERDGQQNGYPDDQVAWDHLPACI
jgi:hypothetical protein